MNIPRSQNNLLAAIPDCEFALFEARLEPVSLSLGEMLYSAGKAQRYAYFPTTSIISLSYVTKTGSATEVAGVGREGVVGFALYMGGEMTSSFAVVQTAGQAFRLERAALKEAFSRAGAFQRLLLRYTQVLMIQIGQTAVCNRHHTIDQQLSRWFLQTLDRLSGVELVMTQELISNMLGVRREAVTEAACKLQSAGCIEYRRGHISVINRLGLERRTCECYGIVKSELNRLATI